MGKYFWLAVTADKYELRICVEETARQLGEKIGMRTGSVIYLASIGSSGRNSGKKIIKIKAED